MWINSIDNKEAVVGIFGVDIPRLDVLRFDQLIFNDGCDIALALSVEEMPVYVPHKWKEKKYDKLQLRLRFFEVCDFIMTVNVPASFQDIAIDLNDRRLHVRSKSSLFELKAKYSHARVDFSPYRADEVEFVPAWYHQ